MKQLTHQLKLIQISYYQFDNNFLYFCCFFFKETVQENATIERLARMDEKQYDSYYRYPDEYHTDVLKQMKQRLPHVWYPRV